MDLALFALWCFLVAFAGGLVGLVLGNIRLPATLLVASSTAAGGGANLAISAIAALTAATVHIRHGRINWRLVAWMAPPSVVGAVAGGYLAGAIPDSLLLAVIAAVLIQSAVELLRNPPKPAGGDGGELDVRAAVASGAVIGLLGGLVGLILGSLRMPALLRWVGETPQRAVGTNVTVGVFVGVAGALAHLPNAAPDLDLIVGRRRRVDPRRAARLAPDGAAVGGGADQGDRRRAAGGRGGLHRPSPNLTRVDLQEETADVLGRLIRFNTVNPPGDERECQEWLKAYLEDAGFECELAGTSDGAPEPRRPAARGVGGPGARLPLARRHRARVARGLVARPVVGRAARRLRVGPRRARHEVADRGRGGRRRRARTRRAGARRAAS